MVEDNEKSNDNDNDSLQIKAESLKQKEISYDKYEDSL
jgi:hypothetical protein